MIKNPTYPAIKELLKSWSVEDKEKLAKEITNKLTKENLKAKTKEFKDYYQRVLKFQ